MKIEEIKLPNYAVGFLKSEGYTDLFPPQQDSIGAGILDGNNVLVAAPTASGKTLIAMLAILNSLSKDTGKIVYLSPLRALAAEKFEEFKKLENVKFQTGKKRRKIKVQMATGDFEGVEKGLEKSDVLVMTNEKMDSIMRHGAEWLDEVSLVIVDEVHLMGDQERGPTLEIILTKLNLLDSKPQIVALSATITNSSDIAEWLNSTLVKSNWRPVPLLEGVYDRSEGTVLMKDGSIFEVESSIRGPAIDLGLQSVVKDKSQCLLFAETRSRSVSLATKASDAVSKILGNKDKSYLEKMSQKILDENEHTELVKRLAELVKKGVAFHHAGLNQNCRRVVEKEFRNRKIRLLSSTPTLAAGVNLPARRVVVSSIRRYNPRIGANRPISILEYKQLCGRAGRPQFDRFGESIIVGDSNREDILEYYINGEPEPIASQITDDKSLRTHILSLVATTPGIKKQDVLDFFLQTFGGIRLRKPTLKFAIDIANRFLIGEGFLIKKGERYAATRFGKKVSMLYLDPLTATEFRKAIDSASENTKNHTFGFLHLVSISEEFFPKFSLRNKDYETASIMIENSASELLEPISEYDCNRSLLALNAWLSEFSEVWLSDNLGIESGDMHRMVETSDWLVYCLREIAKEMERADLIEELDTLRQRIRYGIKRDLVDLVQVKGIGRIRARQLYKKGIKTRQDLARISVKDLAEIDKIGSTLADNIKAQIRRIR